MSSIRTWQHGRWAWAWVVLALAACGSEPLTVTEYAEAVEVYVGEMGASFAEIDSSWESEPASLERALVYWESRLEIRDDFLAKINTLHPPDEIAGSHAAALDVFERITAADQALAARVAEYETITDHEQWLDTPEGVASLAVLEDVYAFCRLSQEEFDATNERQGLSDAPWLPTEMKETVKVAFGCPPQE